MVPFRLLVRFKIFQLAGVAALAVPINTFLSEVKFPFGPGKVWQLSGNRKDHKLCKLCIP